MTLAQMIEAVETAREEYREYASESRANGCEVLSFDDWAGRRDAKAEAMDRWLDAEANDELDLY